MGTSISRSERAQRLNKTDTQVPVQDIRRVILALLAHCEVPYIVKPYDQFLHDHCLAVCEERGYPTVSNPGRGSNSKHDSDQELSLLPFLPTGVCIASTSYDHLKSDLPRLTYIALYSAFVTYLDDFFKRDVESVALFGKKLMRGEAQGHPILDGMADLLNDTETHFGRTAANIIVHDTLGFLNSLILDYETQGVRWSPDALRFPNYIRLMSGIPAAYAMFIFPTDMPLTNYIQSMPEIRDFICYLNDVLSFYKEQMRGEEDNYISLVSASHGVSKSEVLQKLANDVGRTSDLIKKILGGSPAALHAWSGFKAGYVYFHTSSARYKLDHLDLAKTTM